MKVKEIEISGKKYTLTANRSIIKTVHSICPELISLVNSEEVDETVENLVGVNIFANLDVLFYNMIKIAHPNINKEKSDEILEKFEEEYEGVTNNLIKFALSVFQSGDQIKKKKIDW